MLEEALKSGDTHLSSDLLDRIRSILILLLDHADQGQSSENLDPFTKSLNCVSGVALHGIIQYLYYVDHQQVEQAPAAAHQPSIQVEVLNALDEKLDKTKNSSTAIQSVFGAYLPQLHYLNSRWAEQNATLIFPELSELSVYWEAAWDAYISYSEPYKSTFNLLISHYQHES